jgi:hypothetical protein
MMPAAGHLGDLDEGVVTLARDVDGGAGAERRDALLGPGRELEGERREGGTEVGLGAARGELGQHAVGVVADAYGQGAERQPLHFVGGGAVAPDGELRVVERGEGVGHDAGLAHLRVEEAEVPRVGHVNLLGPEQPHDVRGQGLQVDRPVEAVARLELGAERRRGGVGDDGKIQRGMGENRRVSGEAGRGGPLGIDTPSPYIPAA